MLSDSLSRNHDKTMQQLEAKCVVGEYVRANKDGESNTRQQAPMDTVQFAINRVVHKRTRVCMLKVCALHRYEDFQEYFAMLV